MDGQVPQRRQTHQENGNIDSGTSAARTGVDTVVHDTIIPHLLLRCRDEKTQRAASDLHVETLARLLLSRDPTAAGRQVSDLLQAGMTATTALHEVVSPAARRLGALWFHDSADFVDVAVASTRLTSLARRLCRTDTPRRATIARAPLACFMSPEAERHGLGAMIAAHDFRQAGWQVCDLPVGAVRGLGEAVAATRCDLVGISLGSDRQFDAVAAMIDQIHQCANGARPMITVGGPAVSSMHERVRALGADLVVDDSRKALRLANEHLSRRVVAETLRRDN